MAIIASLNIWNVNEHYLYYLTSLPTNIKDIRRKMLTVDTRGINSGYLIAYISCVFTYFTNEDTTTISQIILWNSKNLKKLFHLF